MKTLKKLSHKLTKGELKNIFGGNDPDLSYPMCTPRQCETLDMKCDRLNSCPPLVESFKIDHPNPAKVIS